MSGRARWCYAASVAMSMCHGILLVGTQFFVKDILGAGPAELGMLNFLGAGSYVVGCFVIAPLCDRHGRRPFIVLGALVFALSYLVMAWAGSIWWVYALMIPQGLGAAVFWTAVEASLADETPAASLGRALGLFNITWSVGEIGGNLLGGAVTDRWPRSPFLLVAAIDGLIALLIAAAFGREGAPARAAVAEEPRLPDLAPPAALAVLAAPAEPAPGEAQPQECVGKAYFRAALAANLAAVGAVVIMRSFFVEIAKDPALGWTGAQSSVALALTFVSQTMVFYVMGRTRFWHYRFSPLAVSQAALAAMCLYSAFSRSYAGLLAACAVAGACAGVPYASSIFYALRGPAARGRASGLHEGVLGIGSSLCPLLGGYVAALWGFARGAYVFAPAVLAAALVFQAYVLSSAKVPGGTGAGRQSRVAREAATG